MNLTSGENMNNGNDQNKTVTFDFCIDQRVTVIALEVIGLIVGMIYDGRKKYDVVFWVNGERKQLYLESVEISSTVKGKLDA